MHAELAENGVVQCLRGDVPEIYRRDEEYERKDPFYVNSATDIIIRKCVGTLAAIARNSTVQDDALT